MRCCSNCEWSILPELDEEIYALYDEKYFGIGVLIVHTVNDEIDKFMKITSFGEGGFPQFLIRGYEKNSKDSLDSLYRTISFSISIDDRLFCVFNNLSKKLNNQKLYSIDPSTQGKNNLQIINNVETININLNKDILGVKNATDFIDIYLGDNYSCQSYDSINEFYNELSKLSVGNTTDEFIRQLIMTK